jgi:transcriptional regulator with XRE-family HTH domain
MHKIAEILDLARKNSGLPSDNKLSDALDVARAQISQWRHGTHVPKPEHAPALAKLANLNEDYVLLCILDANAKHSEVKRMLRHIAGQVKKTAAVLTLGIAGILGLSHAPTARAAQESASVRYYGQL